MVHRSSVMGFVNGYSSVNDIWCDNFFLNHWLDMLVDVVVEVLASDSRCGSRGVGRFVGDGSVLVLACIAAEKRFDVSFLAVLE